MSQAVIKAVDHLKTLQPGEVECYINQLRSTLSPREFEIFESAILLADSLQR